MRDAKGNTASEKPVVAEGQEGQRVKKRPKPKPTGGRKTLEEKLTDKHIHFCRRFALHNNAARAGREADFSAAHVHNNLLKSNAILAKIEEFAKEHRKRFEITQDRIRLELARLAFSNIDKFVLVEDDGTPVIACEDVSEHDMASIAEITQECYAEGRGEEAREVKKTKFKLHAKVPALDLLARMERMYGADRELGSAMDPLDRAALVRKALLEMDQNK